MFSKLQQLRRVAVIQRPLSLYSTNMDSYATSYSSLDKQKVSKPQSPCSQLSYTSKKPPS
jgi:hypothetical protein